MKKNIRHTIYNYIGVFDPANEGWFNVSFPEFPGCATFGRTFEEAKEKAKEVLELWLGELRAHNEQIPMRKSRPILDEVEVSVPI